jgi:DNA-binding FadR family transcriptional regulator
MSRLHRNLMRVLIGDIVGGVYPAGSALPREADLAARFGVSRGVARESLRGLEERGLVTVKHGRGATVNPDTRWDVFDPYVLAALLAGEQGAEILAEYLECRRILEIEAASLAAERATETDLVNLSDAFARMSAGAERVLGNPAAEDLFHEADVAFHQALSNMTEPVHQALAAARRPLARPEHRLERGLPEHRRILAAIASRDPEEARAAMSAHLDTVERYLREYTTSGRRKPLEHGADGG